ncbi:major histocompatibility complex class I-related gene protein-like [Misgurnus anguillicaudatus]|uniref:major histocompatibility complex class I-related gene protein-like n=1 Tax=Misgurnus anguillicaudatus TaxID=75329 RepID=UPI003CCFD827
MKHVLILLLGVHLSYATRHSLQYFSTAVSGDSSIAEYTEVGLLDGCEFMYFDSNIMKAVPKTEWIRQNEGADYWDRVTQRLINNHQVDKNNIQVAKERFNQTGGVHTIQRMYGCEWDDDTGATDGFFQDGYDGEDFLSLDLKEMRWISPVQQGVITTQKWNNDKAMLEHYKQYFTTECVDWLKKYLEYEKRIHEKPVSPEVSIIHKDSSSPVSCHATGFYPCKVTITWLKNDQEHHEDVDLGELVPNEDGTYQRTSKLRVTPDEMKNNKFSCVVEHQGKIVTADEIRTNNGDSVPVGIIVGVVAAVVLLLVAGIVGFKVYQKKKGFKPVNSSDNGSNSSSSQTAA